MIDWLDDLGEWLDGVLAVGTDHVRPHQLRTAQRLQTLAEGSGLTQLSGALEQARGALQRKDDQAAQATARLLVVLAMTRERLRLEQMRQTTNRHSKRQR